MLTAVLLVHLLHKALGNEYGTDAIGKACDLRAILFFAFGYGDLERNGFDR